MFLPREIQIWLVDRLRPFERNSRTHSDEQVAQVAVSIREFGWTSPILVDGDGTIIAGHARLLAARKLGMTEVPVIVLDHLTPLQRRALVIADNKLALNAGWNEEMLRAELEALQVGNFDLDLVGFSAAELEQLLGATEPDQLEESEEEISDVPVQPVTRPGDLWVIGRHRLICGDCRDVNVVRLLFDGKRANIAITSPPYATQREYDPASGFKPVPREAGRTLRPLLAHGGRAAKTGIGSSGGKARCSASANASRGEPGRTLDTAAKLVRTELIWPAQFNRSKQTSMR